MLRKNAVFQAFLAAGDKRKRRQTDPEKGEAQEPERTEDAARDEQGDRGPAEDQEAENEEELENEEEVIDELERERIPEPPRLGRKVRRLTDVSTISGLTGTSVSSMWSRVKSFLDPRTSDADLESYVPRYRYLPILAGVIIPFSILLEIGGLTEPWYIRTQGHTIVETRKNTPILEVGLGFSMASAVAANVCLIVRFMEKKIKAMTMLCVLFLTIHDAINIVTLIAFGVEHRANDGFTYGQAFWMTVFSTAVSSIVNITLIVDAFRTPDFPRAGSGLTRKQRTLAISVITLLSYIALGALIEVFLMDLSFINALYFIVVTIETIGFGEITPQTGGSRAFTCIYAVFGIVNLAVAVGLTRETVLEGVEVGYRKRAAAVRERRKRLHHERRVWARWRTSVEWRLRSKGQPVWVKGNPRPRRRPCVLIRLIDRLWPDVAEQGLFRELIQFKHVAGYGHYPHPRGMRLNVEALSWPELEAAAMEAGVPLRNLLPEGFRPKADRHHVGRKEKEKEKEEEQAHHVPEPGTVSPRIVPKELEELPPTHARLGGMVAILGNFAVALSRMAFSEGPAPGERPLREETTGRTHTPRRSIVEQYQTLRQTVETEERWAFYVRLILVFAVFFTFWMVGSAIFMATEKWKFGTAVYFCFMAFTTIGYGDVTPETPTGRAIFVFWALLGAGTVTILISILTDAWQSHYKSIARPDILGQAVKRYRQRTRTAVKHPPPTTPSAGGAGAPDTGTTYVDPASPTSPETIDDAVEHSQKRAEDYLNQLPEKVLKEAQKVKDDVQYLLEPEAMDPEKKAVPESLRQLMHEISGAERFGGRIKDEILRDSEARHELLAISIEKALQTIVDITEETIKAVKERDRMTQLHSTTRGFTETTHTSTQKQQQQEGSSEQQGE
ncbi:putative ion channel [Lyophyllum shimeji]|uniref:Ion channel n=1 Tax=Lyophyllum shimeji TaxID=47721 RepID=A0A9P3UNA7_LYOSH|nr:putative ion channel [Lyophyllum shimeji]